MHHSDDDDKISIVIQTDVYFHCVAFFGLLKNQQFIGNIARVKKFNSLV